MQKHALEALEKLLRLDGEHAARAVERGGAKTSGRAKDDSLFITTRALRPDWRARPEEWAADWCQDWAFHPDFSHAEALGIALLPRMRDKKPFFAWTQSTAFDFRAGHCIHSYPLQYADCRWEEQLAHNPRSALVLAAEAANPVNGNFGRDCGYVKFQILERTNTGLEAGEIFETGQDNFIRFLITGNLPE